MPYSGRRTGPGHADQDQCPIPKQLAEAGVAAPGEAPAQVHELDLTAEMLAELPPELLQELRETTLALNREATLGVIERIEEPAPETAAGLCALVADFLYSGT